MPGSEIVGKIPRHRSSDPWLLSQPDGLRRPDPPRLGRLSFWAAHCSHWWGNVNQGGGRIATAQNDDPVLHPEGGPSLPRREPIRRKGDT